MLSGPFFRLAFQYRNSRPEVFCKKDFPRNFTKFCIEFCEISKNTFFTEHLWATTSVSINSLILSSFPMTSFHLAEASLSSFSWLYTIVCAAVQKYHEISFIYIFIPPTVQWYH